VKKDGPHQRGSGDDHGAARRAGSIGARDPLVINGKVLVQKEQPIRFSPCSPGHIIEMCKYLGVNPDREFYLLSVVRRAVVAPFPQDWAVGMYISRAWHGVERERERHACHARLACPARPRMSLLISLVST
jgi:hypothetical protein